MRSRGVLLVVNGLLLVALGTFAFLAQRSIKVDPLAPFAAANVSAVSHTPLPIQVKVKRGADRVLQRERTSFACMPEAMGCPASVQVQSVTVLLVRDNEEALHAFIAEDPRNGCALEWLPARDFFHDVCHGSIYDRRGQRIGGPSPWNLNELATIVRGEVIWIEPDHILVGACPGCV
jgi:Rieske Fe-S protein